MTSTPGFGRLSDWLSSDVQAWPPCKWWMPRNQQWWLHIHQTKAPLMNEYVLYQTCITSWAVIHGEMRSSFSVRLMNSGNDLVSGPQKVKRSWARVRFGAPTVTRSLSRICNAEILRWDILLTRVKKYTAGVPHVGCCCYGPGGIWRYIKKMMSAGLFICYACGTSRGSWKRKWWASAD